MRTVGSNGEATAKALREAGIQLIAKHGYEAMNLRMLAGEVGIQAGSLYNHIKNKQSFLHDLLHSILDELIQGLDGKLAAAGDNPISRLRAIVSYHIETHCSRRDEVFIGNMELRSLTPTNRQSVVDLRSRYESRFLEVLKTGKKVGLFEVDDPKVTTFALISMLAGVTNWFSPNGRLSTDRLVEMYFSMTLRMLGVDAASETGQSQRRSPVRSMSRKPA